MSQDYTPDIGNMMAEQEKVPGFNGMVKQLGTEMANIKKNENIKEINENWRNQASKEQKDFVEDNKTEITLDDLTMFPKPRKGCKDCYGRGFSGWNLSKNEVNFCSCIMNRVGKVFDQDKLLSYGEVLELVAYAKKVHGIQDEDEDSTSVDREETSE